MTAAVVLDGDFVRPVYDRRLDDMGGFGTLTTAAIAVMLALATGRASAITVWTDWTSATNGGPGSAAGTLDGVAVAYGGQVIGATTNGTAGNWAPDTSFVGGTVTTSPSAVRDIILLNGSYAGPDTITFAAPVTNPLVAIWSLGRPGVPATFTFTATPTLQAGGPNAQYGGSSITVAGNVVSGMEGNGVVQFTGTFDTISWTSTAEHFYGFTVGTSGESPSTTTTTEPTTTTTVSTTTTTAAPPGNLPPDCGPAVALPGTVWPPNHRFVDVAVVGVVDPDGDRVAITVTGIAQDEPLEGGGQGNTCPDAGGVGTPTASVRAERQGTADGRVYHIAFLAEDGRGASCAGSVPVCVPHDQGSPTGCVDQGPIVDALGASCTGTCSDGCAVDRVLSRPLCAGEDLPASLLERLDAAQQLVSEGAGTTGKKAKRLMRRGIKTLRKAVGIANRAVKRGSLSEECAASVAAALDDARTRFDRWRDGL